MKFFNDAKQKAKNYSNSLKEKEKENTILIGLPMDERIKMRPEGVKYCLVNNLGKILDVYENKVVYISTQSTSTIVTGLIFGSSVTNGEKIIYYRDAVGVQYKPSTIADGYIQVETAAGGTTNTASKYEGENSIQFGKKSNEDAEVIVNYIRMQIEKVKNMPVGDEATKLSSNADELIKYKQLLDMGAISNEEYEVKKKELLGL